MTPAYETAKAKRGVKRECKECQVRFYDLLRDPIVCPSCGVTYVPAPLIVTYEKGSNSFAAKSSWRSKRLDDAGPDTVPDAASEPLADSDDGEKVVEVAAEGGAVSPADGEPVLEPDADDADVTDLVDINPEEGKEG